MQAVIDGRCRPKMVMLRQCFRRSIVGECSQPCFVDFWAAVQAFAPTAVLAADRHTPIAHRTIGELLPAFDFVRHLLQSSAPEAWRTFVSNGASADSVAVPGFNAAVAAYLHTACQVAPRSPLVYVPS